MYLGLSEVAIIEGCPRVRGGLYEGFHCVKVILGYIMSLSAVRSWPHEEETILGECGAVRVQERFCTSYPGHHERPADRDIQEVGGVMVA